MIEAPFLRDLSQLDAKLRNDGVVVLAAADVAKASSAPTAEMMALPSRWADLPPDNYLKDGGHYRRRRHSCYRIDGGLMQAVPHRAHWQSLDYNALHGGMQRWFEPIDPVVADSAAWVALHLWLADVASRRFGRQSWFVESHQFRIDTTNGIGRPTPEGAHRDGVDLVAVFLVARHQVKGGETRVFDSRSPLGQRFTLEQPWSLLLLDDERVIHETTPIQPMADGGYRDTLVVTLRRGSFQGG
ncbi:MAG: hypothetical protein RLZZ126_345 [Pseudomonadota bacterium]